MCNKVCIFSSTQLPTLRDGQILNVVIVTKKLLFVLTCLFPAVLFAQSALSDCDHIFKKVQHLPSLKVSDEAFGDTLAKVLASKKFPLRENEITYNFVLTDKSKIDDLAIASGSVAKETTLKDAIVYLADLWKPATQNGYDVCAYVVLKLRFANGKINIEITMPALVQPAVSY